VWLALLASLLAAIVPGPGLVLCFHDGGIAVGVGERCPRSDDAPGTDCDDLLVDGERDLAPSEASLPPLVPGEPRTPWTQPNDREARAPLQRPYPRPPPRWLLQRASIVLVI